jgi:hypothetical protein
MTFNNNYVKEVLFVLHELDLDTATQPMADFLPDSGELQIQGFSPEHGCGTAFNFVPISFTISRRSFHHSDDFTYVPIGKSIVSSRLVLPSTLISISTMS